MSNPQADGEELDDVFRAISDPTRRAILDQLRGGPMNTSRLCQHNDSMTRGGVINHLKILHAAELIRVEHRGRERINHLNGARLQDIYDRWLSPFEQTWTPRLANLARRAESTDPRSTTNKEPMTHTQVRVAEITQQRSCRATPAEVWETLTSDIEAWWTKPYVSEESIGLALHLEPGGSLWDTRANNGGYALATVRGYQPERELILDGEFGIPGAISGRLVIQIEELDPGTTSITFTNTAIGIIPEHLTEHATAWATVLDQLCERLRSPS